jgi:PST family polysaccharide transporter
MSADFYPRLSENIINHKESTKLINDQTDIGLVLASVGIIGVLGFPDLFLKLLYSDKFTGGSDLLQWMTLGMAIKIISWPLGFVIVTKEKMKLFIMLEILWGVIYILLLILFSDFFGLEGVGMAFFLTYLLNALFVWVSAKRLINFRWERKLFFRFTMFFFLFLLISVSNRYFHPILKYGLNGLILFLSIIGFYITIKKHLGTDPFRFVKNKLTNRNE